MPKTRPTRIHSEFAYLVPTRPDRFSVGQPTSKEESQAACTASHRDRECPDECDRGCETSSIPSGARSAKKRGDAEYRPSIAFFTLGTAAMAAGIALIVLNQPRRVEAEATGPPKPAGVTVLPVLLPGGGMLTTGFSF